ncbi:hypothetical protein V9L05_22660 (plasmid) [Bernardetia sp. Wsw4-3y2]|uniref:hypothetical protein n=1 Tax=Bernardetia sp. Wsw4-3y2 TaxID=3127471 RepID=UPI0030CFFB18
MECLDQDIAYDEDSTLSRSLSLNARFSVYFVEAHTGASFNTCSPRRLDENGKYEDVVYDEPHPLTGMTYVLYLRENSDSLKLLWMQDSQKEFLKEPCFQDITIDWFPPYIKRVDKIDYEKFDLPIKKKYLQYPMDGPSIRDEKRRAALNKKRAKRIKRRGKEREKIERKKERAKKKEEQEE